MAGPKIRRIVSELADYVPGKSIEQVRERWALDHVVKIASNENSLGASPKALDAIVHHLDMVHRYPLGDCPELAGALGRKLGVAESELFFANGSDEAIWLLCTAFLEPGECVISSENTFSEYHFCSSLLDGRYCAVPQVNGRYDLKGILERIEESTKILFICNPNNPTGTWLTQSELQGFLAHVPDRVLVVVDQAYCDYADAAGYPGLIAEAVARPNLVLLRTFSKIYGLAGLRIGYAIGHADLMRALLKVKQPFNVNRLAQVAARAALDDDEFVEQSRQMNARGKAQLYEAFRRLHLDTLPTQANFIAFRVGARAAALCLFLESRGVIVRHLESFGLPEWVRVTIGLEAENRQFVALLEAFHHEISAPAYPVRGPFLKLGVFAAVNMEWEVAAKP